MFPFGRTYRGTSLVRGYKPFLHQTHTDQKQQQGMAEELEGGDVKECKDFPPPSVPTTNAASPRLPLGSLLSNTPKATPSRRTLTEDLGSAEALRSPSTTV